jgi:hypothetical protein
MEEVSGSFKILTYILTGKRPLGMPSRKLEENIRIGLKEMGINTRNWVDSAQGVDYSRTLVNTALKIRVS